MKFFILAALVAVAAAGALPYGYEGQPALAKEEPKYPVITMQEDVRNMDGSSKYSYASSDQITREESQYQKQIGSATGTAAQGSTSYIAPDGQKIEMSWVADEHGYRATGTHLPVAPPMPAEIAAMLPTLPKLTFEQLYGSPAAAAPSTFEAPKYEAPKYDAPEQMYMYADAPLYTAPQYEAPKMEMPKYEAPRVEAPKVAVPAVVVPVAPVAPVYETPKMETPKYHAPSYQAPAAPVPVAPAAPVPVATPAKPVYIRSY